MEAERPIEHGILRIDLGLPVRLRARNLQRGRWSSCTVWMWERGIDSARWCSRSDLCTCFAGQTSGSAFALLPSCNFRGSLRSSVIRRMALRLILRLRFNAFLYKTDSYLALPSPIYSVRLHKVPGRRKSTDPHRSICTANYSVLPAPISPCRSFASPEHPIAPRRR
jgi:hypothetical protein